MIIKKQRQREKDIQMFKKSLILLSVDNDDNDDSHDDKENDDNTG